MTVYVDDMYLSPMGRFGRMRMSHMMADTTEELLAMARAIGVERRWLQNRGTPNEHFDIAMSKRTLAIQHGAIAVTMRELALWATRDFPAWDLWSPRVHCCEATRV